LFLRFLSIFICLLCFSQARAIDNIATFLSSETTNSTNLNQDTAYPFKWLYDSYDENVYQHDVTSYAHEIYVKQDGNYFISFSMPVQTSEKSR
jgi:hypothetical protein